MNPYILISVLLVIFVCFIHYKKNKEPNTPYKENPIKTKNETIKRGNGLTIKLENPEGVIDPIPWNDNSLVKKKYKILNYDTLNPIKNFIKVGKNTPIFEITTDSTNLNTTKKDAAYVCKHNNWNNTKPIVYSKKWSLL